MQKITLLAAGLIILGLLFSAIPVQAATTRTYHDPTGDVMTTTDFSGNSQVITSSPYITIANIDLTNLTYADNAGTATVTLKVAGVIENRGQNINENSTDLTEYLHLNLIQYMIMVSTNESDYTLTYMNQTCQLQDDSGGTTNITDYTVQGNTLTVVFPFTDPHEEFTAVNATTDFTKFNFTSVDQLQNFTGDESDILGKYYIDYEDYIPNQPLSIQDASAESNLVAIGRNVQFNCSTEPFSGMPPYSYHWSFGDGTSSTQQNPIHAYSREGNYTFNCTVTDGASTSVYQTGQIKIQGSSSGTTTGSGNMVMIFIAIIVIIAIAGIAIVVFLIRR